MMPDCDYKDFSTVEDVQTKAVIRIHRCEISFPTLSVQNDDSFKKISSGTFRGPPLAPRGIPTVSIKSNF